jgi:hypothetical protein
MANTIALLDFNFIVSPTRTDVGAKAHAAVASRLVGDFVSTGFTRRLVA